ncbi:hypothetical protein DIPPA_57151 [Diplonema papillatum]|nr:hypothetical protein DIPPA_57151 [Diplonema papillatum]
MMEEDESQGDHLMARKQAAQQVHVPSRTFDASPSQAQQAAAIRKLVMQQNNLDSSKQREAIYSSWPDDKQYLQQQVALLQQELTEKDDQLKRAQTDISMLRSELEQLCRNHDSELHRVKTENLSQLIRTFQYALRSFSTPISMHLTCLLIQRTQKNSMPHLCRLMTLT